MSSFDDLSASLAGFSGTVRLFPLPNLVLFPHVLQPLHIFEPRYKDLLEEALAEDGLIALAVLRPGWEKDYEGRPPLAPTACLARVVSHCRLDDGTFNVLVLGVQRVHLLRELPPNKSFREAEVVLCQDRYPPEQGEGIGLLQAQLREALKRVLPGLPQATEQLDQLLAGDVPLGALTDIVSYLLNIGMRQKEALLAELDVFRRIEMLLGHLSEAFHGLPDVSGGEGVFPPEFSLN